MTDTEETPGKALEVLNPTTGEVIDLASAPTDELAVVLDKLKSWRADYDAFRRDVVDEVLRRMDRRSLWTVTAGGRKLVGQSPAAVELTDLPGLWRELMALTKGDDPVLDVDAVEDAVTTKVEWTTKARGINALRKIPAARELIEARERPSSRSRNVRLEDVG